jgi:hypothetical protein
MSHKGFCVALNLQEIQEEKVSQAAGDREKLSPASGLFELQATVQQAVFQKALRLVQIKERGRKDV